MYPVVSANVARRSGCLLYSTHIIAEVVLKGFKLGLPDL